MCKHIFYNMCISDKIIYVVINLHEALICMAVLYYQDVLKECMHYFNKIKFCNCFPPCYSFFILRIIFIFQRGKKKKKKKSLHQPNRFGHDLYNFGSLNFWCYYILPLSFCLCHLYYCSLLSLAVDTEEL